MTWKTTKEVMGVLMTDESIIELVLAGNTHMFSQLVDRHKDKIYGMALSFTGNNSDAQDVSQEIFIKAYKNLFRFNRKSKFSTWLYRVSYNVCIDWIRSNNKHGRDLDLTGFDNILTDSRAGPEESFLEKEKRFILKKAIYDLKEKYRNILILFYFQALSYEETAEVLEIPVKTVETQLYRARKQLKVLLKHETGDEPYVLP
ncbi:MAG: RNA polymerase sigma factor [Ruminiclostridium sp.]|nr:RNA polymerase sigma factor [Ruminiclostridium sp.]